MLKLSGCMLEKWNLMSSLEAWKVHMHILHSRSPT